MAQLGLRHNTHSIQTDAVSQLVKLESCGWLQIKADFKSFRAMEGFQIDFNKCVFLIVCISISIGQSVTLKHDFVAINTKDIM